MARRGLDDGLQKNNQIVRLGLRFPLIRAFEPPIARYRDVARINPDLEAIARVPPAVMSLGLMRGGCCSGPTGLNVAGLDPGGGRWMA